VTPPTASPANEGGGRHDVVVFGTGSLAQLLLLYLTEDTGHNVVAFTATADRIGAPSFSGRPLVPFEQVVERYPPSGHRMFVAVGYDRVNRIRSRFYGEAKAKGYELITYVGPRAVVRGADLGDNCCVFDGATIEPFATLGNDVVVWGGARVSHHSSVGDHSFIAPGATVAGHTTIGRHCFLGVNSTVRDGISVGDDCLVGAGATVLRDTAPRQVLVGPPARPYPGDTGRFFE
jgi:sugar O-acyltransferase (sialic acid O-acetyltransferase NeuD family)